MISNLTYRKRLQERAILEDRVAQYLQRSTDFDRYVDIGVVLCTVVADPDGEELIPGKPRMRIVRRTQHGGLLDTRTGELVGPSRSPRTWYCSEDQEVIAKHDDEAPLGQLVDGSEGAGKTTVLPQWHYFRWLEHLGEQREGGQTAPTKKRLRMFLKELRAQFPRSWYRYIKSEELVLLCDGTRIQLVSTHQRSADEGSPVQGYSWSWCGRDELQDQVAVHEDIQARGRSAKIVAGVQRYKQCATGTMKTDATVRSLRAMLLKSGDWIRRLLLIARSPFVAPSFVEAQRRVMSDREFRRRFLAEDLPPELATYPAWDRELNTVCFPGGAPPDDWEDVTQLELARQGAAFAALGGHDPGALFDVTELLRAYQTPETYRIARVRKEPPRCVWVVFDEITTERTTTEQHVDVVLKRVRPKWRLNLLDRKGEQSAEGPRMFIRADPYGNNDSKPDRSCYTVWRNAGVRIEPAAYSPDGKRPGRVPKDAGIELVNTLFCNAAGERRLFVAVDEQSQPCAPQLVSALESDERDSDGKAETAKKNVHDISHWPASLRYAVWAIERPRLQVVA